MGMGVPQPPLPLFYRKISEFTVEEKPANCLLLLPKMLLLPRQIPQATHSNTRPHQRMVRPAILFFFAPSGVGGGSGGPQICAQFVSR